MIEEISSMVRSLPTDAPVGNLGGAQSLIPKDRGRALEALCAAYWNPGISTCAGDGTGPPTFAPDPQHDSRNSGNAHCSKSLNAKKPAATYHARLRGVLFRNETRPELRPKARGNVPTRANFTLRKRTWRDCNGPALILPRIASRSFSKGWCEVLFALAVEDLREFAWRASGERTFHLFEASTCQG